MEKRDSTVYAPGDPEGPKSQGFRVRVEQPEKIFQAAQGFIPNRCVVGGRILELGFMPLVRPFKSVMVDLEGGKDKDGRDIFNILGKIALDQDGSFLESGRVVRNLPTIISRYSEGNNFDSWKKAHITGPKGTGLLLELQTQYMDLFYFVDFIGISTGKTQHELYPHQFEPALLLTRENLNNALSDISGVLQSTIDASYSSVHRPVPNVELVLDEPKEVKKVNKRGYPETYDPRLKEDKTYYIL